MSDDAQPCVYCRKPIRPAAFMWDGVSPRFEYAVDEGPCCSFFCFARCVESFTREGQLVMKFTYDSPKPEDPPARRRARPRSPARKKKRKR